MLYFQSVDYKGIKESEEFEEYVKLTRELQRAPIEKLDENGRKAFFINIYNALVIHATAAYGPPTNWFTRIRVKYFIILMLTLNFICLYKNKTINTMIKNVELNLDMTCSFFLAIYQFLSVFFIL